MNDTAYNHSKSFCQIMLLTRSGPCKWRDTLTPFQLLAQHCTFTGKELWLDKAKPEVINIGETPYPLSDFGTLMIKLFLNLFISEGKQNLHNLVYFYKATGTRCMYVPFRKLLQQFGEKLS